MELLIELTEYLLPHLAMMNISTIIITSVTLAIHFLK